MEELISDKGPRPPPSTNLNKADGDRNSGRASIHHSDYDLDRDGDRSIDIAPVQEVDETRVDKDGTNQKSQFRTSDNKLVDITMIKEEQVQPKALPRLDSLCRFNDVCSVCLINFEIDENVIMTPCRHSFHSDCLNPWIDAKITEVVGNIMNRQISTLFNKLRECGPPCPNCNYPISDKWLDESPKPPTDRADADNKEEDKNEEDEENRDAEGASGAN